VIDLLVHGVRLLGGTSPELHDIHVDGGSVVSIERSKTELFPARKVVEAGGALVSAPYVEPHIHLDSVLTAGQPRWNESGTLWEGISCWAERRAMLSRSDVVERVAEVLRWQVANGVLYVRSHVDVTDPNLVALEALLEIRENVRDVVDLQLVAFPQEGIYSSAGGVELLGEAARRGVDGIGAIPHFEDTREDGVRSVEHAMALAAEHGLFVDIHCDEIDDEQSRFVEVLAAQAIRLGLHDRATASHATAMGSYSGAYSSKLHSLLVRSGANVVCNPLVNLHLGGRFDGYPKRRGLTQVKEMLAAGINVAFGHDDIMDPWYPLGTANPVQVAHIGAHATQLTAPREIAECFRMITDRAARVLGLGLSYEIHTGTPANFIVLPAVDAFDVIRRQVRPSHVVSRGRVVATTPACPTKVEWPGSPPVMVDWSRGNEVAVTSWRLSDQAAERTPPASGICVQPDPFR